MDKREADRIITEYTNKLFGFALSKTHNISQAEELASQTTLVVYEELLKRDNIVNINGYIYKIAANVYANYITGSVRSAYLSLDEVSIPTEEDVLDVLSESETYRKVRLEITYLSKMQREIVVAHYFERRKLSEIASDLSLPIGTVKWHLFEAKKTLMKGMNIMRKVSNLGVAPIRFDNMGHSGKPGKLGDTSNFLQKRLAQNIAYAAYWEPKTVNEIAEELNVSPIFIEDEVVVLEEYGFMDRKEKGKYLTNIYITETNVETVEAEHRIYNRYAGILCEKYVPILINYLKNADKSDIYIPDNDFNLLLWSVITFACDYKLHVDKGNDSERYSVKRKDGGEYIAFANVAIDYNKTNFNWQKYGACGNMNRGSLKGYKMRAWQLDTYYDGREGAWENCLSSDFDYLYEFISGTLKKEDSQVEKFQRLYEKGYLRKDDLVNIIIVKDRNLSNSWNSDFSNALPGITEELKKIGDEFDNEIYQIRKDQYPAHMHDMCKAWSSNCFCHNSTRTRVLEQLLNSGVLKLPTIEQKAGLTTLMFCDKLPK